MKDIFSSKKLRIGLVATLLGATGCAEYHKRVLQNTQERGNEFSRTLAKEYEALGKIEQDIMYDESSADYYYRKAIRSKQGYCVGPTTLDKWDIEEDKIDEIRAARERLTHVLSLGARCRAPEMTAKAQSHFDCWVEQQSEGWQQSDIQWCRSEFYKAISEVELTLMGGIQHVMPSATIFFENNSSDLSQEAMDIIENIAENEKMGKYPRRILLVGRTDQIGDLKHNKMLSRQRAIMVKKALVHNGVPSHLITIKAAGETPGPNVDAHNRRVDILFLEY